MAQKCSPRMIPQLAIGHSSPVHPQYRRFKRNGRAQATVTDGSQHEPYASVLEKLPQG